MSDNVANGRLKDISPRTVLLSNGRVSSIGYALLTLILAVMNSTAGAFDTDEINFTHRLLLWLVICGLIVGQSVILSRSLPKLNSALHITIVSIFITVLTSLEVHLLKYTPLVPHKPDPIVEFILFMAPTVIPFSFLITLVELAISHDLRKKTLIATYDSIPLPIHDGWPIQDIVWIKASDHYLEVADASGKIHFLRGRMKDAVSRLKQQDGLQIHRSWWVSRNAVKDVKSNGRDRTLILQDNRELPIGRSRIPVLKAKGWLN